MAAGGNDEHTIKQELMELAASHGFCGPLTGSSQIECGCKVHTSPHEEGPVKVDYYAAVNSFLNCIKYQERDRDEDQDEDNSILLGIHKTKDLIMKYKKAIHSTGITDSDEESTTSDVGEVGQEEEAEIAATLPERAAVNTLWGPEVEKQLRSGRDLQLQMERLKTVLTEVLSEEGQEHMAVQSRPSVGELLSPSRHIAEAVKQLETHKEEYPDGITELPADIEESLDKCAHMLAALDKPNA